MHAHKSHNHSIVVYTLCMMSLNQKLQTQLTHVPCVTHMHSNDADYSNIALDCGSSLHHAT